MTKSGLHSSKWSHQLRFWVEVGLWQLYFFQLSITKLVRSTEIPIWSDPKQNWKIFYLFYGGFEKMENIIFGLYTLQNKLFQTIITFVSWDPTQNWKKSGHSEQHIKVQVDLGEVTNSSFELFRLVSNNKSWTLLTSNLVI